MQAKVALLATAGIVLALPAIAQQVGQQPPPATNTAQPPVSATPRASGPRPGYLTPVSPGDVSLIDLTDLNLPPPSPPVEYPSHARRDPWVVGAIDPVAHGLGANPFGSAS